MVIFDPFQAFLGAKVDMFRANEVRPVLAKLFDMCERNNCSCAIIAHMGKGGSDKSPVNRSLGSVDIPAAMRSILQLIRKICPRIFERKGGRRGVTPSVRTAE